MDVGNLYSGPHVCEGNTLPTDPSLRALAGKLLSVLLQGHRHSQESINSRHWTSLRDHTLE